MARFYFEALAAKTVPGAETERSNPPEADERKRYHMRKNPIWGLMEMDGSVQCNISLFRADSFHRKKPHTPPKVPAVPPASSYAGDELPGS